MKISTMKTSLISLTLCLLAFASPAAGQETKPESRSDAPQARSAPVYQPVYKLDLAVYELQDGKRTNVRKYVMFIKGGGQTSSIKVGNRIPVSSGTTSGATSFQYVDVGLSIRCRDANEKDGMLTINTDFELGSLIQPEHSSETLQNPVIRQLREDGYSQIPIGKPSVVLSIDDTNTTRTVQVEMTATKL